jgi:putative transcriptional regulator
LRDSVRSASSAIDVRNRLRELCGERGWSQQELGERLGVSRQTVNAPETEKYDPSLPLAFRISDVFDTCPQARAGLAIRPTARR